MKLSIRPLPQPPPASGGGSQYDSPSPCARGPGGGVKALHAARLFTGEEMRRDGVLLIEDGRVRDLIDSPPPGVPVEHLAPDLILAPGFIDVQVNGGGGVLFNDSPDLPTLRAIAAAHRRFGTTAFLPTLITNTPGKMRAAAAAVGAAMRAGEMGILGLHLEGPFLNPARKGVHPEALIRRIDEDDLRFLCKHTPRPLLLTLAPECVDPAALSRLAKAGVTIAIGHSAASWEEASRALRAGARGFTHLFNAMPPLAGRDPGPVGAALASDGFAGVIADGHHVHPANLRLALRAKGAARLMLVTDAMASVGSDIPAFSLGGRTIRLANGRLTTEDGTLAGAHLDMASAVRNAVVLIGASIAEALHMASATPADFLGVSDRGRLVPGAVADAVAVRDRGGVDQVWMAGDRLLRPTACYAPNLGL
jgi:N-acetylglucosamine-6-phosphate deacetylase